MKRRMFLTAGVAAIVAAAAALIPPENVSRAQMQGKKAGKKVKRKKLDNRKGDGNPDGKDTVDGALWLFSAQNARTREVVEFRYRVSDWVIYDPVTDEEMGKTEHVAKNTAKVTLDRNSPFPAVMQLKIERISHYSGQCKRGDQVWNVKLTCIDR